MMWDNNYGGPFYRLRHVRQGADDALHARRHRGRQRGAAGDECVREDLALQAPVALGLHVRHEPELKQNLDWFWYYWLFTTEAVNESIEKASISGGKAQVTVRQWGEMPSPVVLQGRFRRERPGAVEDEERRDRWPDAPR